MQGSYQIRVLTLLCYLGSFVAVGFSPFLKRFRATHGIEIEIAVQAKQLASDCELENSAISKSKRVLMIFTNHGKVEGTDLQTGWYLPECAHPYNRFAKAGYKIDFASIMGGLCPVTPSSLTLIDSENDEFWENPTLRAKTENTLCLKDCDPGSYDLLFFVGGFGTMWDFPYDSTLARFTQDLYERGGVIGAVCHGPIALMNVKLSNNEYLISGREVTAFCNEEEAGGRALKFLPEHPGLGRTCEDIFLARGAKYSKAAPWGQHVVASDRIFTGQNPASAGPLADAIVSKLNIK